MTQNPLYKKTDTGFNSNYVTKLLRNYRLCPACLYISFDWKLCNSLLLLTTVFSTVITCRSHKAILKTPNEMFYDGELKPCADEFSTNFYCNWEHLPKTVRYRHAWLQNSKKYNVLIHYFFETVIPWDTTTKLCTGEIITFKHRPCSLTWMFGTERWIYSILSLVTAWSRLR